MANTSKEQVERMPNRLARGLNKYGTRIAGVVGLGLGLALTGPMIEPELVPRATFPDLVQASQVESLRGTEYFNSPAYDSLVARGAMSAAAVGNLRKRITEPVRQHLLPLMALREVNPDSYRDVREELRVGILIDALNQATYFNAWGLPHRYWRQPGDSARILPVSRLEEPVAAIIELDTAAIEPLRRLLSEKRRAPHWGQREPAENEKAYRVADYALALIRRIEGKIFPPTQEARDDTISKYLKQVAAK